MNRDSLDRYITGNYGEDQFKNTPKYKVNVASRKGDNSKSWTIRVSRVDGLPVYDTEIEAICRLIEEGE